MRMNEPDERQGSKVIPRREKKVTKEKRTGRERTNRKLLRRAPNKASAGDKEVEANVIGCGGCPRIATQPQ